MNVAFFGGFGKLILPPGWKRETALAVFGGGEFDVSDSPPALGAKLTTIAVMGSIKLQVAPGTRVRMHGFSLLGTREALVSSGEGPALTVTAISILGSTRIEEKPAG